MAKVNITAYRWAKGWELCSGDDCPAQVRHLSEAGRQVIDYPNTVEPETDHSNWEINIDPDLSGLDRR